MNNNQLSFNRQQATPGLPPPPWFYLPSLQSFSQQECNERPLSQQFTYGTSPFPRVNGNADSPV